MTEYLRPAISNGIPREQALIRRWWHEQHGAAGRIVWEYYLRGKYADAIWFCCEPEGGLEAPGTQAPRRFPLKGQEVVVCEAKSDVTPEVIGQALVYTVFARQEGATVLETVVFAERGSEDMQFAARELGVSVVVERLPSPP